MSRVLVVDDQAHVRTALTLLFSLRDIPVAEAQGPEDALAAVRAGDVGVVVQDMNFTEATTSGEEGVSLFRAIRALDPAMPVVLMTAWASLETAVMLVKEGAADYVPKPWDDEALLRKVRNLLAARRLSSTDDDGPESLGLVCESAAMKATVALATKVAPADVPLLITGPNGAGKGRLAELVQRRSRRADGPFVSVDVGALPDELLEAELFGAEAGAYTGARKRRVGRFEAADGGTLFLDEIGNLSLEGQQKLLRVLQSGELSRLGSSETLRVDLRVIAATNVDLREAIRQGRFREDLYYRLAVIELAVPPLAERTEDVLPLAEAFVAHHGAELGREVAPGLGEDAVDALLAHPWPGNVRELENAIRRALLVSEGDVVHAADLGLAPPPQSAPRSPRASHPSSPGASEDEAERRRIEEALERAEGVVSRAAAALGLSRQALYRRMHRLGVSVERQVTS